MVAPGAGDVLQTHAAERPRGRACPVCSQLNRAGQRGGSGSSVPRPAVCVRASSHTSSNNGKKEVSTTTTQKAMRGPWTCGASKMGRSKKREDGGKNLGPSSICRRRLHKDWGDTTPPSPIVTSGFPKIFLQSVVIRWSPRGLVTCCKHTLPNAPEGALALFVLN